MGRKGGVNQRRTGKADKYDQSMFYGTVKELRTTTKRIMVVNLLLKYI